MHGYTHRSPATLPRERGGAELVAARRRARGPRAPSSPATGRRRGSSPRTPSACWPQHGLAYSSNFMDDIRPYRHAGSGWSSCPSSGSSTTRRTSGSAARDWTKKISTTAEVDAIWREEFAGIRAPRRRVRPHHAPADHRPARAAWPSSTASSAGSGPRRRADRDLRGDRRRHAVRAIVTGAARGLGAGVAERLERDGGAVARLDVLAADGGLRADVADEEQAEAAFARGARAPRRPRPARQLRRDRRPRLARGRDRRSRSSGARWTSTWSARSLWRAPRRARIIAAGDAAARS